MEARGVERRQGCREPGRGAAPAKALMWPSFHVCNLQHGAQGSGTERKRGEYNQKKIERWPEPVPRAEKVTARN